MKKRIMPLLGLLLTIIPMSHTTVVEAQANHEIKFVKTYNKLRKINQKLSHKLYEEQQANTKSSEDWAKFVKNIKFLKNNQVELYVTSSFKELKSSQRENIVNQAQLFTLRIADSWKDFGQTTYMDGLATIIFCDGGYVGRSKYLDNKEFTWNK
ncbi:hypothetical protein [Companilactobacillus heilongjiangensis]|uniref:Uncharacterized protein n=1 Tax=Companilactobacillus heilongjiangensis TaxID=1074467 RepID=A0A0K2LCK6_9LACO|nr:hypothetical protein [Companilactobacillus heilongjiangensis]ALB29031.1 hypothetical protein JP39_06465 [Companilactobacillus heilongjiangensis]